MRKVMCLAMVCILSLLTGCSGGTGGSQNGTVNITVWHDKEEAVIAVLEEAVKVLEPEIVVTFEKKTGMTESFKLVGNDRNAAPDMYFFAHDKIGVYAEMGILEPVTGLLGENALEGYVPLTVRGATYKGEIYQVPLYFETLLFTYNEKYMAAEDVPATTEQLYAYMQRKTKYGHYGFVEQHSTPYYAAGWIHGFGGSLITDEGVPLLESDEVKAALAYHRKFVEFMPGETEYATVNTLFTEGMAHSTMPCVFYGDEKGTTGLTEEDRRPMLWQNEDGEIQAFYRQTIAFRQRVAALRRGSFRMVSARRGSGVYHYVNSKSNAPKTKRKGYCSNDSP